MYDVIGHDSVRASLASWDDSFAVVGPPGVGRSGIVSEWSAGREVVPFPTFSVAAAKEIAHLANSRPITVSFDADSGRSEAWVPLLKPLEEGLVRVAALSSARLPEPVESRVRVFRVGYLPEAVVLKILANTFPRVGPRPFVARACKGSLDHLDRTADIVSVFDPVNKSLADRYLPAEARTNPMGVFYCLRLACAMRMGVRTLPFSKAALLSISQTRAVEFLHSAEPAARNEARNAIGIFYGRMTRA